MLNISAFLEDAARTVPDRHAIVFGDTRLSYSELNVSANRVANLLRSIGIARGDNVALCCPNLPWFPAVYFGILKAGAAVVPLNPAFEPWEIAYHLDDSDAKVLFYAAATTDTSDIDRGITGFQQADVCEHCYVISDGADVISPVVPGVGYLGQMLERQAPSFDTVATESTDTAVILYGSGSTGRPPAGAELSHLSMFLNAIISSTIVRRQERNVDLVALPLFHAFGQTVCLNSGFFRNATLVLMPRFEPKAAVELMIREQVTCFAAVPAYWTMLTHERVPERDVKDIAENLRIAVSGGAALPTGVLRDFTARFGAEIVEGYGLAEASPVVSFNRPDGPHKPGSVGQPIWGVDIELLDSNENAVTGRRAGEIAIRGHNVMKGYYRKPVETAEVLCGPWLRTGDVARCDADGYFYIIDRAINVIIRNNISIWPSQVEDALMSHPDVNLAAVVGVPDRDYGQEVKAYVVPVPGSMLSKEDLRAWGRNVLGDEKCPYLIEFRNSLPMTATGKILRQRLDEAVIFHRERRVGDGNKV